MAIDFALLDVFTDRALEGNQLAVFPEARSIAEERLQALAREINFSETVFVYPPTSGADARIRIFTPVSEPLFAGHPVLGTAVLLAEDRGLDTVTLETGAGPIPIVVARKPDRAPFGRMKQPIPTLQPFPHERELLAALGLARSELPVAMYDNGMQHVYVELASPEAVAAFEPDPAALVRFARTFDLVRVGINCFAGEGNRWTTRMFAPADGTPEDPATGSAAGPLSCHLARHGRISFGQEIEIAQGAQVGRPSTLYARATGSAERIERVEVGGHAVIVGRGTFNW
ncbi:MAG: PhzF family phenazine biosynthesis protein [Chloroflexi bacterium]|nr:PhzF family phenazine biosynthesis protein [Chloroflexota bacterium]